MRYFKQVIDGYIPGIGTGDGYTEITEAEYNELRSIIRNKPAETETIGYRLKTDLTLEAYDIEPPIDDEEVDLEEALAILLGGVV